MGTVDITTLGELGDGDDYGGSVTEFPGGYPLGDVGESGTVWEMPGGYPLGDVGHYTRQGHRMPRGNLGDAIMTLEGLAEGVPNREPQMTYLGATPFPAAGAPNLTTAATKQTIAQARKKARATWQRNLAVGNESRRHRAEMMRLVDALDTKIVDVDQPQLMAALAKKDARLADVIYAQIKKDEAARDIAAARVVKYAKTEALANVLVRSGQAQEHLLTLAERAKTHDHAKILIAAHLQIRDHSAQVHALRKKQVATWTEQTHAARVVLAQATAKVATVAVKQLAAKPQTPVVKAAIAQQITVITKATNMARDAAAKIGGVQILPDTTDAAGEMPGTRGDGPEDSGFDAGADMESTGALGAAFGELGFSITGALDAVGGALKTAVKDSGKGLKVAGGAVVETAKKVGAAVKKAVEKVGAAAKALLEKGACALSKNPAVLQAAAAAGGTLVAGPAGGGAAGAGGGAIAGLLGKACPSSKQPDSQIAAPDDASTGNASAPAKKSIVPLVAGGGAAAALLFALL